MLSGTRAGLGPQQMSSETRLNAMTRCSYRGRASLHRESATLGALLLPPAGPDSPLLQHKVWWEGKGELKPTLPYLPVFTCLPGSYKATPPPSLLPEGGHWCGPPLGSQPPRTSQRPPSHPHR